MTPVEAHDPTASATTYPDPPPPQTRLSRNEIETLCLKAARGAGLSWGLAEEAGFAAGWLAARGVDGAAVMLDHLTTGADGGKAITVADRIWSAQSGGAVCPILCGAALDDHAGLKDGIGAGPLTVAALRHPVLAIPFLARMAQALNAALEVTWDNGSAIVSAAGGIDAASLRALSDLRVTRLVVARSARPATEMPPPGAGDPPAVSGRTLAGLNALAMHTTVPASEQSRRGAGASADDND